MPDFFIPIRWSVYNTVRIEADNIDEAIRAAGDAELTDGEYIDGSFEIETDSIGDNNELDQYPKCQWDNHISCPNYKKDKMKRLWANKDGIGRLTCSFYDKEEKYCFNKDCKMQNGQNQISSVVDQAFNIKVK